MKVILLRHATRNFTMGDVDLNDEGLQQAQTLTLEPSLRGLKTLLCSPKKRAQLTIEPLSRKQNLPVEVIDSLDQMRSSESEQDFNLRVKTFLELIEKSSWSSPLLICSHSDWLGIATQLIPCDQSDLRYQMFQCAEFLEFEIKDGLWLKK